MSKVRTRLYCHGLGDCNLIEISKPTGGSFWVLIDCGIHTSALGGSARVAAVVADIRSLTDRLDVVVATHEHWDHISGFHTAADGFAAFTVGEVWLAWTEDPADAQARALDRFKGEALAAVAGAAVRLRADPRQGALANGLDAMLGFEFGLAGERSRDAREAVKALAPNNIRYLEPGSIAPLPAGLGVTAYVLGPPRDLAMLALRDDAASTYGIASALNNGFGLAFGDVDIDDDMGAPFDSTEGMPLSTLGDGRAGVEGFVRDHYNGKARRDSLPVTDDEDPNRPLRDQAWRRIDSDWLGSAAELAMQLDNRTNNTSLVLAFDLGPAGSGEGDVLLFAADAQVGNWRSWTGDKAADGVVHPGLKFADGTTSPDLIKRTVLYKVGHHGSGNATLRPLGLEAMVSPKLTAFIPTDEVMAKKVKWGAIPEPTLIERLREKGRVIRSDDVGGKPFVDLEFG